MLLLPVTDAGILVDYKVIQRGFWVFFQISKGKDACRGIEVMADRPLLESLLPAAAAFGVSAEIAEEEHGEGVFFLEAQGSIGRTDRLLDVLRDEHGLQKLRNPIVCAAQARKLYGEAACQAVRARIRPT